MTRQLITKWYERAKIDYSDLYVKEYIAYNAWFRKVTNCVEDHEAIKQVLKRFVIWDDYLKGQTLVSLGPILEQIAVLTHKTPLSDASGSWDGIVKDALDWRGLIYFWYYTRCELFHGLRMPGSLQHDRHVQLAYESLCLFMTEIVRRMRYCFTDTDFARLSEVRLLLQSEQGATAELKNIESQLYQKFIHSHDIWNVDMERV
jgi:hypothetical protein